MRCVKTRAWNSTWAYYQYTLEKQELLYWVTPKIHLCQTTGTAHSQGWKLKPSLQRYSFTAGTGVGSLQRRTEISLWNRNLPKATCAKPVIWWKSYQIPEVRLRYYHVMPYFSLLFPLNRTSFSQHHIQSYSAKTAMIISESRGFRGRLWTYNVLRARERAEAAGSGEFLWEWTGPCDTGHSPELTEILMSHLISMWHFSKTCYLQIIFSSLDVFVLPSSHVHFLFNCVVPKGRNLSIPVEELLGCI